MQFVFIFTRNKVESKTYFKIVLSYKSELEGTLYYFKSEVVFITQWYSFSLFTD